ncbi:MAG: porin [Rickettsiaceae bacterium]|nr:porin [Rickettsiaceae bacterium]
MRSSLLAIFLLLLILTASLTSFALEAKLSGSFFFQFPISANSTKNTNVASSSYSRYNKNLAFATNGEIRANIVKTLESGAEFGAIIKLYSTAYQNYGSGSGSHIYYISDFGKIELGSNNTAMESMSINADSIMGAARYDDLRYLIMLGSGKNYNILSSYYSNLSDYSLVYRGLFYSAGENIRNITYYSPKFLGTQIGVSYAPDSSNVGSYDIKNNDNSSANIIRLSDGSLYYTGVKNILSLGLSHDIEFTEDSALKFAVGLERGATSATKIYDVSDRLMKFKNYNIYNAGLVYTYGNYGFAASFADAGKSFASIDLSNQFKKIQNKLYTFGVSYQQGPIAFSITYLKNQKFNGMLDAVTFGARYKVFRGLLVCIEATPYKYKLTQVTNSNKEYYSYGGTSFIAGLKMFF